MYQIDKEKFGLFLVQLRKEKELTQKQFAEKLCVSDKAVSKWERGLSFPDITLLLPMSEILEVTVTELLYGSRLAKDAPLTVNEVEKLVSGSVELSVQKQREDRKKWKKRALLYGAGFVTVLLEIAVLLYMGITPDDMLQHLLVIELLGLIFGSWFWLIAKEKLPVYYDENNINYFSDGIFRMHIAGLKFNNRNWPYIIRVGRIWTLTVPVVFPLFYLGIRQILGITVWNRYMMYLTLPIGLSLLLFVVIEGKRHE